MSLEKAYKPGWFPGLANDLKPRFYAGCSLINCGKPAFESRIYCSSVVLMERGHSLLPFSAPWFEFRLPERPVELVFSGALLHQECFCEIDRVPLPPIFVAAASRSGKGFLQPLWNGVPKVLIPLPRFFPNAVKCRCDF